MSSTKRSPLSCLSGLVGVTSALSPACGGSSGEGDGGPAIIVPPGNGGVTGSGGDVTTAQGGGGIVTIDGGLGGAGGIGGAGGEAGGRDGGTPGSGGSTVPACGQPGLPCCDANGCDAGGCCVSGICMAAGGTCVGLGGGICNAGACGACGGPGLPCCGANPATGACTAPGTVCNAGNDDVWVFVNKKLAVDLGGIHLPVEGSVTIDDDTEPAFGLAAGNVYEVAVFQAERQTTSSTFKITLSAFNTAPSACHPN